MDSPKNAVAAPLFLILFLMATALSVVQGQGGDPFSADIRWATLPAEDYGIPPYARFLEGLRICVDPGHGGDAFIPKYKRGPTGVREAEVNLRVAGFLKQFLDRVGAETVLTRTGDLDYSLAERAACGNRVGADLFLSLHHNAAGSQEANYTTVWYHGPPADSLVALDVGQELLFSIGEALRTTFVIKNGLMDDRLMYESGFGVLRGLHLPGILTEASFFSNPDEEQRLADPDYNRREAFGIFLGLARWAAKGLPRAVLKSPESRVVGSRPSLLFYLDDGLEARRSWGYQRNYILEDSIAVRMDGELVDFRYDATDKTVRVDGGKALSVGGHTVSIEFQNAYKHHNMGGDYPLTVVDPTLLEGRVICVDPGHGGTRATDPTRIASQTGVHEEETNLKVALRLKEVLAQAGAEVVLTREDDSAVGLYERVRIALDAGADLFLSLHHNGCFDPEVDTPQVFFHGRAPENPESVRLAAGLLRQFEQLLGRSSGAIISDQTIYDIGFAVLRHSFGKIPAVIGEPVYFTNRHGALQLGDEAVLDAEARAYLNAVIEFFAASPADDAESGLSTEVWRGEEIPFFERIVEGYPSTDVWRQHLTLGQEWLFTARDLRKAVVDGAGVVIRPADARLVDDYYRGALHHLEMSLRYFPNSPRAASLWDDVAAIHDEMLAEPSGARRGREARLRLLYHHPGTPQAAQAERRLAQDEEPEGASVPD